jgi:hypothetical protein
MRIVTLRYAVLLVLLCGVTAQAQTHRYLFRQRPVAVPPGANATSAQEGDVDESIVAVVPDQISIDLPDRASLLAERTYHQQRGPKNMVWRGALQTDSKNKVTLTFYEGLLVGHIQSGADTFVIRPGRNGRSRIEKLNPKSFAPEWGHDHATHGHEMVPPTDGATTSQESASAGSTPTTAAAGATVEITLMSVYTPQARAAAGGTTQIQAQIQAAVDQANTAFINSDMIARYNLTYMTEVAYNDSGNITTDLNWVTGNATVAALRNTYAADMVSLITENGAGYCGIGWVQRNPGASFANYAFQVTARGCLTNSTLAHEHGHNLGMEHDPANSGTTPSGASYPWSFGHYVNGSFRTIMSYDACTISCPRVLHFSNPDVLYNGIPTGIVDQRDNAHTGDLTTPIVANFRTGGPTPNNPPAFINDPITKPNATLGSAYSDSLAGSATDPDNDPLTYAKTAGPAWLIVAANGALSGTPDSTGIQSFTVSASDAKGGVDSTTMQITVVAPIIVNSPPVFSNDPIVKPNATLGIAYSNSLAGDASDPNNDPLTYAKTAGPAWLTVAANGALNGTPGTTGLQTFTVTATDGKGAATSATLQITVVAPVIVTTPAAPSNLAGSSTLSRRIDLVWTDNSINEKGFKIERSTNGTSFKRIATVGANVTTYSDGNRTSGRTYYYRVLSYNGKGNSAYSNTVSVVAK